MNHRPRLHYVCRNCRLTPVSHSSERCWTCKPLTQKAAEVAWKGLGVLAGLVGIGVVVAQWVL